jgi:hypothetical protein
MSATAETMTRETSGMFVEQIWSMNRVSIDIMRVRARTLLMKNVGATQNTSVQKVEMLMVALAGDERCIATNLSRRRQVSLQEEGRKHHSRG